MKTIATFRDLQNAIDIVETNVTEDSNFDLIRTHRINPFPEKKYNNILYFLTYSKEEEVNNDWCRHFDLRKTAKKRMSTTPNATFVIEKEQAVLLSRDTKYIIVPNIRDAIDQLFQRKMPLNKPLVIGVTGSVGKTTCVGTIDQVLSTKYRTLRIYSTRINPLVLKGHLLNFLNDETEIILMEYSIYAKNHVEDLVDLLSPDIAIVLNVTNEHLGKLGLKTYEDIVEGKLKIFKHSKVNYLPRELSRFAHSYQNVNFLDPENCIEAGDRFNYKDIFFKPFFNTDLSLLQFSIAINIAYHLGLTRSEIQGQIESIAPVENRFLSIEIYNKSMIFVGETVHNSRLETISDNNAKTKTLIIRKIGARSTHTDAESLLDSILAFNKAYIFNDIGDDYVSLLKPLHNVEVVTDHSFIKKIEGSIIYIYSGYFNTYRDLDFENLLSYDENYKVKGIKK